MAATRQLQRTSTVDALAGALRREIHDGEGPAVLRRHLHDAAARLVGR
jgi:hypothetical protein